MGHSSVVSVNVKCCKVRRMMDGAGTAAGALARLSGSQSRTVAGRPFDDNIAEDYIQSDLPPGTLATVLGLGV